MHYLDVVSSAFAFAQDMVLVLFPHRFLLCPYHGRVSANLAEGMLWRVGSLEDSAGYPRILRSSLQ